MIRINNYVLKYNQNSRIDLTVNDGEIVALTGENGIGKSTLLKLIAGMIKPSKKGEVIVDGLDLFDNNAPRIMHFNAGYIFQNPDEQIVFDDIKSELAFGPENKMEEKEAILQKINITKTALNIDPLGTNSIAKLSGGEKQRVAIGDILIMNQNTILMDEVTSMQDKSGRKKVMDYVYALARKNKKTVIYITQNNMDLIYADRVIALAEVKRGENTMIVCKERDVNKIKAAAASKGLKIGAIPDINPDRPRKPVKKEVFKINKLTNVTSTSGALVFNNVNYSYGDNQVINNLSYMFEKGNLYLVSGKNGSGKSTFGSICNATLMADSGTIYVDGIAYPVGPVKNKFLKTIIGDGGLSLLISTVRRKVGFVVQYPERSLFKKTVLEDVMFGVINRELPESEAEIRAKEALNIVKIGEPLWDRSIENLSGAEKRLVAIAGILAMDTDYIVLDEPFAGLDKKNKTQLKKYLMSIVKEGRCVIVLGHESKF